jgi:hypothetical protein
LRAWAVGVSVTLPYASAGLAAVQAVPKISKEELRAALGDDDVVVIDLRKTVQSPAAVPRFRLCSL